MNACWIGCRWSPSASPSIVVISAPSWATASARQLLIRRPSAISVHAPHWPRSQPFFVPVSPSRSRRASSRVVRTSTVSRRPAPFTRRVTAASLTPTELPPRPVSKRERLLLAPRRAAGFVDRGVAPEPVVRRLGKAEREPRPARSPGQPAERRSQHLAALALLERH